MSQITINIDRRHMAAMPMPSEDIRRRITDIEERAAVACLAKAGRHDAVMRMVGRAESVMRLRLVDRHNEILGRATP